jgi:hypothetical protein
MTTPAPSRRRPRPLIAATVLGLFAVTAGHGPAYGHGEPLQIGYVAATNTLTVAPTAYDYFDPDENFTSVPGFGLRTVYPGFTRTDGLPADATVSLRFLAPLTYWNEATGTVNPLPESVATVSVIKDAFTMSLIDAAGITGTNPLPMTTFVGDPGEHYHFPAYRLTNPDFVSGLYGLWAEALATGPNFAGGTANPSDPLLIVLNYGITDEDQYHIGAARLAAVPVPEPSTLALCAAACAVAGWRWRHSLVRRRSRRPRS